MGWAQSLQKCQKAWISFSEAETVFLDDNALLISDPEHAGDEDRFLILGLSASLRLLVVVHCYRESAEVIRLISARKATRPEQRQYSDKVSK